MARTNVITLRPLVNSLEEQILVDSAITDKLSMAWKKLYRGWTPRARETWRITKSLTNTKSVISHPLTIMGKLWPQFRGKLTHMRIFWKLFTTNLDADRSFSTEQVVNDFLNSHRQTGWGLQVILKFLGLSATSNHAKQQGPDGIQNIILQLLPRLVLKLITKLFNRSLVLNYFPT
jgi:hypothetical protein